MGNLIKIAGLWIFDFRSLVGMWLMRRALAWMPSGFSPRLGVLRGIHEQTQYDRYSAYTLIMGAKPYKFHRWRELSGTMACHSRQPRPWEVRDTSKIHVLRENA